MSDLLTLRGHKAQTAVNFNRAGGRMDGKHLLCIVPAHGREQLFADAPAVLSGIYKESADVLGLPHTQHPHQRVSIEGAVEM